MAQNTTTPDQMKYSCLIADDSEFARKNVSRVVTASGGEVVGEAKNGLEAVDLYFKLRPNLVLLDITMPEMDGIATLRQIMERDKEAKVVIVSSAGHKEMVWKALCLGAKGFISKPFTHDYAGMIIESGANGRQPGAQP